jgi:hypothetical protein
MRTIKTVGLTLFAVVLGIGLFFIHVLLPYIIIAGCVIGLVLLKPWKWFS